MKRSVLSVILVIMSVWVAAQRNPANIDHKCSRPGFALPLPETRATAVMNKYDVVFYFLDIALERTSTYVSGNVLTRALAVAPLDTFSCELINNLTVDSVIYNGQQLLFSHAANIVTVPLPSQISTGSLFEIKVYYHGDPQVGGGFFSGISNDFSPSWGNQVTWTLSEPFNANQWWPCKQSLSDKIDSAWIFITTSNTNKAGSNGLLTAITPMAGNKLRFEWKTRYMIDYYLISASVAKYVDYTIYAHPAGTTDSIMVQNYVYDNPSTLPYFQDEIDTTIVFLELYSDLFGLYPFINEKYGHCMAPMSGGMEHQTMTTLGWFEFYLVCHELTHMWWGDYVTCATWSDIWINEGFASYGEYLAAQYLRGYGEAQNHMVDVHNNVLSLPDGSVYIPPAETNDESRIFDGRLSYDKGSAIIHMLRFELGDDSVFFDVLKTFLSQYSDSVATGTDFRDVAEAVSGKDFTDFFQQWYFGEGYPSYDIVYAQWGDSVFITSVQHASAPAVTPLFKMLMEFRLEYSGGDTSVFFYQDEAVEVFRLAFNKPVTGLVVDPENWVLNGPGNVVIGLPDYKTPATPVICSPNPCSDMVYFSFPDGPATREIIIYELSGKELMSLHSDNEILSASVRNLAPGTYIFRCVSGHDTSYGKFIKQ